MFLNSLPSDGSLFYHYFSSLSLQMTPVNHDEASSGLTFNLKFTLIDFFSPFEMVECPVDLCLARRTLNRGQRTPLAVACFRPIVRVRALWRLLKRRSHLAEGAAFSYILNLSEPNLPDQK